MRALVRMLLVSADFWTSSKKDTLLNTFLPRVALAVGVQPPTAAGLRTTVSGVAATAAAAAADDAALGVTGSAASFSVSSSMAVSVRASSRGLLRRERLAADSSPSTPSSTSARISSASTGSFSCETAARLGGGEDKTRDGNRMGQQGAHLPGLDRGNRAGWCCRTNQWPCRAC